MDHLCLNVYKRFDKDGSGTLNAEEIRNACYSMGYYLSEEQLALALHKLDTNNDGVISYEEFQQWWKSAERIKKFDLTADEKATMAMCIQYFRFFDKDNSGYLNLDEFKDFHADLRKNGFDHYLAATPEEDILKMSKTRKVEFGDYISWLVSIGALNYQKAAF